VTTDWTSLSDGQLWSRAAGERDGEAFGELFVRHMNAVYNHCFRRTGSWAAAEDLTSVVFLEAWRKRRDVRLAGQSILPWLLAVANNATRNADRSLRRHHRLLARLPEPAAVPDIAEDAARRADDERAMRRILAELRTLGEPERGVIALVDWAGLSYAEAATALGIPVGTVRSRLARAREQLRDRLAEAAQSPASVAAASPVSAASPASPASEENDR
jgi:RNA polymerase sigma-70 factor, ECF subfamily